MNRINRLTAILIHLQTKRIVKAREIASRFEISIRTVYRDIRALEDAGVPIGAQAGEGYYIIEGYHLPPVMFTKDEAGAFLMGGKLVDRFSDKSVKTHFESALYKIKAVLASDEKDHIDNLDTHMEVLKYQSRDTSDLPDHFLSSIQSVLGSKKIIRIDYLSRYKNEHTARMIEPIGLCFYGGHWHLIAFCRLRNDYRDFRVDRIKNINPTYDFFNPKDHKPLDELIEEIVKPDNLFPVTVRFTKDAAEYIRDQKGYYGFTGEKETGETVEMNFMISSYAYFGRWILTFLDQAEIVAPEKLKYLLRDYSEKAFKNFSGT